MLDHLSLPVRDLARAAKFYDAVLATIGLVRTRDQPGMVGYGVQEKLPPEFWIHQHTEDGAAHAGRGLHLAFRARSRALVHAFHETALREGGTDGGSPGPRPEYTPGYYGGFVFDLDGFKIEAVARDWLHMRRAEREERKRQAALEAELQLKCWCGHARVIHKLNAFPAVPAYSWCNKCSCQEFRVRYEDANAASK